MSKSPKSPKTPKTPKSPKSSPKKETDPMLQFLSHNDSLIVFGEEMLRHSANVNGNLEVDVTIHMIEADFILSKAAVTLTGVLANAEIHMYGQDPINFGGFNQTSPTYAIKTKKQEALIIGTNTGTSNILSYNGYPGRLNELNQKIFDTVLNSVVTKQEKKRYITKGRKLEFLPDTYIPIPPFWVRDSPLVVTHDDDVTYISSPFTMSISSKYVIPTPERFQGAYYGKPITAAQAYEWIVYDAFGNADTFYSII